MRPRHPGSHHGALTAARHSRRDELIVVLTLIAEVLSGETLVTPGGAVDTATACGLEAFTWDGWLEQVSAAESDTETMATFEVDGVAVETTRALAD